MALPSGVVPKTVTIGIASFFDGTLAEGTATIIAPVNVVHTPTNRPIFSSQMSQRFVDGVASFNLCPTDAPGLNRVDWTYTLRVVISGALVQPDPVYFTLPAAGPDSIDLDSLVTVPSSAGIPVAAQAVTSINGQYGDVVLPTGSTLTPTATKTAAYTVAVGELAVMNVAAGATALTLPAAPADKAQVGFRAVGATNAVPLVVTRGGTATIGDSGATSVSVPLSGEVTIYQYHAAGTRWLAVANVKPMAALDARYPTQTLARRDLGVRGRIVFIVDDAQATQRTIAAPKIEAVGGRLNFAIPSSFIGLSGAQMTGSDVTDLYNRGHQIMSHSVTHPNMTTQTAAQRVAEWDDSKAALEALTAPGAITDFVMPNNASNLTTQQEAYGRYLRVFTAQNAPTIFGPGQNGLHLGRNTWSTTTHQLFLQWIKRIAFTGETYIIFTHSVETADASSSISPAMLDEAIALAASLGVQWVRADEALVGHQPLFDPTFSANLGVYHTLVSAAGGTVDIVTDPPPDGFPGTRSLRMVNTGAGLNRVQLGGSNFIVQPGEEYTFSVRVRQDKTSGTGGGQFLIRQYDEFGTNTDIGPTGTVSAANAAAVTPWTQISHSWVPDKKTRTIGIFLYQPAMVGTTWWTHPHIAPTRLGALG